MLLTWQAEHAGAGLGTFELQWRTNPGSWQSQNTISLPGHRRSTWFAGSGGTEYAFRLRAIDINGQAEAWPAEDAAETRILFPETCAADSFEPDDTPSQAAALNLGEITQRNLCPAGNADWFQVELEEGLYYHFSAVSVDGGAAVKLTLFDEEGVSKLSSAEAPEVGYNLHHLYQAQQSSLITLKFEPLVNALYGTQAVYTVQVNEVIPVFLPMIAR